MRLLLISDRASAASAELLADQAAAMGFVPTLLDCSHGALAPSELDRHYIQSDIALGVLSSGDSESVCVLCYFLGKRLPIVLYSSLHMHRGTVLRECPLVDPSQRDAMEKLWRTLKNTVMNEPEDDAPSDTPQLIAWLREQPSRLQYLSNYHLEKVVGSWLAESGMQAVEYGDAESWRPVYVDSNKHMRTFVSCKSFRFGRKLSIEFVQQSAAEAGLRRCDFVLLVTNSEVTAAAMDYAMRCVPRVFFFGKRDLEEHLHQYINRRPLLAWTQKASLAQSIDRGSYLTGHIVRLASDVESATRAGIRGARLDDLLVLGAHGSSPSGLGVQKIIKNLCAAGVRVWHDDRTLGTGMHCSHAFHLRHAARASEAIVLVYHSNVDMRDQLYIQVLADELAKRPGEKPVVLVVCEDPQRARMSMPWQLDSCVFLKNTAGWQGTVAQWLSSTESSARNEKAAVPRQAEFPLPKSNRNKKNK